MSASSNTPSTPHPVRHRIRVTELGEYIRHMSCQRRFKLGYRDGELFDALPFSGKPLHTMDPVLAEQGAAREDEWAESLEDLGILNLHTRHGLKDDAPWGDFVAAVAALRDGEQGFGREVHTRGDLGVFHLEGRADFLIVRWQEGRPRLWIVECKASRKDRTYHRMQVALYRLLILAHMQHTPLVVAGHTVREEDVVCTVVRVNERNNKMFALGDLSPLESTEFLEFDAQNLLAQGSTLDTILQSDLDDLPYVLDQRCDDCKFSVHCLPEAARNRRLHLLGFEPDTIRTLHRLGIGTIDDLANLDPTGADAERLRHDEDFQGDLDAMIIRARARRSTLPPLPTSSATITAEQLKESDEGPAPQPILPLPNRGKGHLPAHESREEEAQQSHRLIRVFLSVNYDYAEDRVGALSAHVTRSDWDLETSFEEDEETGAKRPIPEVVERRPYSKETRDMQDTYEFSVVQPAPWSPDYAMACGQESNLLQGFFREVVKAIQLLAMSEPAPIHFYVWSSAEIKRLLESAARVGNDMLNYLRELFGCREQLEQLIYSELGKEIDQRYALGWTGRGLTVVTSLGWYGRFHWLREVAGEVIDLEYELSRDLFDFRTRLATRADGSWAATGDRGVSWNRYEIRSRFFDNLTAPYFHAYWGRLEEKAEHKSWLAQSIRDYNHASEPQMLESYLIARVQAMRWLEEHISPKNDTIAKPLIDPNLLPTFKLGTTTCTQAAQDFLRLDHHIKYTEWLQAMLVPPYVRVSKGESLGLHNLELIGKNTIKARIDVASYHTTLDALRARVSYHEGGFCRLHEAPSQVHEGQSMFQLLKTGRTCHIDAIDWDTGEVQLSVVRGSGEYYYAVNSWTLDDEQYLFDKATIDPSITDYVSGKVESRLVEEDPDAGLGLRGAHVNTWFHPARPTIPPQQPLAASLLARHEAMLRALRLGGEHTLEPRRVEIVMRGLDARIQLIQGPPGTGKTSMSAIATLTRIIARRSVGDVVMITATTHTAVETLLERIASIEEDVRRAAREQSLVLPKLRLIKLDRYKGEDPRIEELTKRPNLKEINPLLEDAVVILAGTINGMITWTNELDKKKTFRKKFSGGSVQTKLLVVDEASMMVASHLIGITTMLAEDGELLMAGDHRQLTPIISHDWENDDRPPAQYYRMHESAFDAIATLRDPEDTRRKRELSGASVRLDRLERSYRLPGTIRALIQPVYAQDGITLKGRPEALDEAASQHMSDAPWREGWQSAQSLHVLMHDERESRKSNRFEAKLIARLLESGVEGGFVSMSSVAVVTPHRAQRALLEKELEPWADYITVIDTVERLQGGEQEVIIISATVSDPVALAKSGEFVLDLQRSNVAFSRTRQKLFVVAARGLFAHVPTQTEIYESAKLWKHLRRMCTTERSRTSFEDHEVIHMTV